MKSKMNKSKKERHTSFPYSKKSIEAFKQYYVTELSKQHIDSRKIDKALEAYLKLKRNRSKRSSNQSNQKQQLTSANVSVNVPSQITYKPRLYDQIIAPPFRRRPIK